MYPRIDVLDDLIGASDKRNVDSSFRHETRVIAVSSVAVGLHAVRRDGCLFDGRTIYGTSASQDC